MAEPTRSNGSAPMSKRRDIDMDRRWLSWNGECPCRRSGDSGRMPIPWPWWPSAWGPVTCWADWAASGGGGPPDGGPRESLNNERRSHPMLWTIAVVLLLLWVLGLVSSYTMGGFIHILLVLAIVVVLIRVISGRRAL